MAISQKVVLAAIFYFGHIFAFCRLISNSVLGCFPRIICKKHTLARSRNLFSRNHPTLCFRLKRDGRQMSNTYYLALSWRRPLSYRKQSAKKCSANQWTGFYMITVPVMKELTLWLKITVSESYNKFLDSYLFDFQKC